MSSKKWLTIAGVVVLVALVVVGVVIASGKSSWLTGAGVSSSSSGGSAAGNAAGGASSQIGTATGTATGGTTGGGTTGGTTRGGNGGTSSTGANSEAGPLRPFPHLPDPGIPAQDRTTPMPPGEKLPPLSSAPPNTIAALKLTELFSRATYTIVMRPYGLGPDSIWGSGLVIKVDSSTPIGNEPKYNKIVGANLLVIPNTKNGGTVTVGGTYKATLTWRSDGSKLLPILSKATRTQ